MTDFPPLPALRASSAPRLLPFQMEAADALAALIDVAPIVSLVGAPGSGRTTILQHLAQRLGGYVVTDVDMAETVATNGARESYEAIHDFIAGLMRIYPVVFVDEFENFSDMGDHRRHALSQKYVPSLRAVAQQEDRRLVLSGGGPFDGTMRYEMPSRTGADFRSFFDIKLGADVPGLDLTMLHRHASMLDLYQLDYWTNLIATGERTTQAAIALLESEVLKTNLDIGEVEELNFSDLPGTEAIAEALEAHVILPFKNKELAQELGLKPTRGVLLYGPPGSGKTSVGRALAHRMEGRFFMIDGSFITEPPMMFFGAVESVIAAAKAASPSVLFIDDADVLFQIEHISGLSRYLLSLMDGLESEVASNVCVIMTAMDAHKLPEALLRSGRVELWLETKAPDPATRASILGQWITGGIFAETDLPAIAAECEGFTPADLRRLVGEARLLYAADVVAGHSGTTADQYLRQAIAGMIEQRDIMKHQLGAEFARGRAYA
jgi:transitional endoplasmic reticulum ATPase